MRDVGKMFEDQVLSGFIFGDGHSDITLQVKRRRKSDEIFEFALFYFKFNSNFCTYLCNNGLNMHF